MTLVSDARLRVNWARIRAEVHGIGAAIVYRDAVKVGGRQFIFPNRGQVKQAFRRTKQPVTIWPEEDRDGRTFIVISGEGDEAERGLGEFLSTYRDEYPEAVVGEPTVVRPS